LNRKQRAKIAESSSPPLAAITSPALFSSTYLGGSGFEIAWACAADRGGNVYVGGDAQPGIGASVADLPVTQNALQKTYGGGGQDGFVAKYDKTGNLLWSTYLGGSDWDGVFSLTTDANGNVVVTGVTASADFPTTNNAVQKTIAANTDVAFVTVISADGTQILYSTFFGGTTGDGAPPLPVNIGHIIPQNGPFTTGVGISVGSDGTIYVCGGTNTLDMPVTSNAPQSIIGGEEDGYVARIDPTKSGAAGLLYCTYLGGLLSDFGAAIVVDPNGNAFVTGETQSENFPTTLGAFQRTQGRVIGGFVTKLNATGTSLIYSTFFSGSQGGSAATGGAPYTAPSAIAIDPLGRAYIDGETNCTDLPTTTGVTQPTFGGQDDGFVTELSADGSSLTFSTYLGGSDYDGLFGLKLDSAGNVFVGGYSASRDLRLVAPVQTSFGGYYDGWVAELAPDGTALLFSSYLGGDDQDSVYGLDLWNGRLFVAGRTASTDFPVTHLAPQTIYGGGVWDNFLSIINLEPAPVQLTSVVSRKTHGAAGTFDVDLMSGSAIECRSGGVNGNYTVLFTFSNSLANVGHATVSTGAGVVSAAAIGNDAREYVVDLTGVTDAQTLSVSLSNVVDSSGNASAKVSISLPILVGDTNGDRFTDAIDVSETKSRSGNALTGANFREDVNVDGFIDAVDAALVKSKSGAALPR
jgi:hypothetical protein